MASQFYSSMFLFFYRFFELILLFLSDEGLLWYSDRSSTVWYSGFCGISTERRAIGHIGGWHLCRVGFVNELVVDS